VIGQRWDLKRTYVDPLIHDEKLRQRLSQALTAGMAARKRARRRSGITGLAMRFGTDPILRTQLADVASHLNAAKKRAQKGRSHKLRTVMLISGGVAAIAVAAPSVRRAISNRRHDDDFESIGDLD
jgi:hypothetical protein